MSPPREPADAIRHVVRLYTRGIICPSEMWYHVVLALPSQGADDILNALPADTQQTIRDLSLDRTSLSPDPKVAAAHAALIAWCQSSSPT